MVMLEQRVIDQLVKSLPVAVCHITLASLVAQHGVFPPYVWGHWSHLPTLAPVNSSCHPTSRQAITVHTAR